MGYFIGSLRLRSGSFIASVVVLVVTESLQLRSLATATITAINKIKKAQKRGGTYPSGS